MLGTGKELGRYPLFNKAAPAEGLISYIVLVYGSPTGYLCGVPICRFLGQREQCVASTLSRSHQVTRSDSLKPPEGFAKVLNKHGYGLQYSVLRAAEDLTKKHRSSWVFEAAEFPVEVKGAGTRIDFILRHSRRRQLLLAECKRANPAVANWCFVSAPYVRDGRAVLGPSAPPLRRLIESGSARAVEGGPSAAASGY